MHYVLSLGTSYSVQSQYFTKYMYLFLNCNISAKPTYERGVSRLSHRLLLSSRDCQSFIPLRVSFRSSLIMKQNERKQELSCFT